jgi:hypothetical protein
MMARSGQDGSKKNDDEGYLPVSQRVDEPHVAPIPMVAEQLRQELAARATSLMHTAKVQQACLHLRARIDSIDQL